MADIDSFEKRRARNLVWSAAGTQDFEPPLLVYDGQGRADLYWNSVIGAIYKHFDWSLLQAFYGSFLDDPNRRVKENLFWLALEVAAYAAEADNRPAYASLRREYVRRTLADMNLEKATINHEATLSYVILLGHVERLRAQEEAAEGFFNQPAHHLTDRELGLLEAIEHTAGLTTQELIVALQEAFKRYLPPRALGNLSLSSMGLLGPVWKQVDKAARRLSKKLWRPPFEVVRPMAFGLAEHSFEQKGSGYEPSGLFPQTQREQENFWKYINNYFGKPLYPQETIAQLERSLCLGPDANCKLYYTRGDYAAKLETGSFIAIHNRSAEKAAPKNRQAYEARSQQYKHVINSLTSRFRNSLLVHLEQQEVRSRSGRLKVKRIWRGLRLNEKHLFTRVLPGDPGNITVDLLLDGSSSQAKRQETIAAQAYVLAASLTRCGIPVRISSFCSMSGYTIMTIYRDYEEPENNERVFRYFTAGGNRDGLGIKMLTDLMATNTADHRLLITLSDCEPHDMIGLMDGPDHFSPYEGEEAINVTASAVRRARAEGISVLCLFTGEEENLPAARRIYDRHFVRIRNLGYMAEAVSNLLQSVIRSYDIGNG